MSNITRNTTPSVGPQEPNCLGTLLRVPFSLSTG